VTSFRLSAHRRLVTDPLRGRLLLQAAYVALADADALDPYAWPPVHLSEETRAEIDRLRALSNALAADAARFGVRGGIQEAFGEVFAAAEAGTWESREEAG
jgi:hypothetical protein